MVSYCVAYGCTNDHDKRKMISFHCFPFKRPEVLNQWIEAIRRENWMPTKASKLCGEHFLPEDYVVKPGLIAKLLKPDAVPSIFSFTKHLLPTTVPAISIQTQDENIVSIKTEPMEIELPSTSTSHNVKKLVDRSTQTYSNDPTPALRRKVRSLNKKVRRRDAKISKLKDLINKVLKRGPSNENENLDTHLQNHFEDLKDIVMEDHDYGSDPIDYSEPSDCEEDISVYINQDNSESLKKVVMEDHDYGNGLMDYSQPRLAMDDINQENSGNTSRRKRKYSSPIFDRFNKTRFLGQIETLMTKKLKDSLDQEKELDEMKRRAAEAQKRYWAKKV